MPLYRGRLIDHIRLDVADFDRSARFYKAIMAVLGIPIGGEGEGWLWADELWLVTGRGGNAARLAFQARDHETVARCYKIGLALGCREFQPPGPRPYHPSYFAAELLDPDGNEVEFVYHGDARRSAEWVRINLEGWSPGFGGDGHNGGGGADGHGGDGQGGDGHGGDGHGGDGHGGDGADGAGRNGGSN